MKKYLLLIIWLLFIWVWLSDYLDTIFNASTRNYVKSVSTKNILQKSMAFTTTWNATGGVVACINCNGLNMFKNIYLTSLSEDWAFPRLSIDNTWKVYKEQVVGASAYITWAKSLVTTSANVNYPVPWPFQNDLLSSFRFSGDLIVYTWNTTILIIIYNSSITTSTDNIIITADILINWVSAWQFKSLWSVPKNTTSLTLGWVGTFSATSWTTIQLVLKTNISWAVLSIDSYSTIAKKFY